jgi:hypothetical protein
LRIDECATHIVQYHSVQVVKIHGKLSSIEIKRKQLNSMIAQSVHDVLKKRGNERYVFPERALGAYS